MSILTIIRYLRTTPPNPIFYLLFAVSVVSISVALFTEFVFGYPPCALCIYERIPYLFLGKISFSGALATRFEKFWMICAIITLTVAVGISTYHTGVERGWFGPSDQCNPELIISDNMSNADALAALEKQPVATCTKAPFKIMMLSMAEWNLLLNIGLLALTCMSFVRRFYAKARI